MVGIEERVTKDEETNFIKKNGIENESEIDEETFEMNIVKKKTARDNETTMIMEVISI